jgi:hypothetical protein
MKMSMIVASSGTPTRQIHFSDHAIMKVDGCWCRSRKTELNDPRHERVVVPHCLVQHVPRVAAHLHIGGISMVLP